MFQNKESMHKTIAIIPARGGSKRLPNKNILLLGGIPLLAHSICYAKQQHAISATYVSTNDPDIKKIALQYGALVIDRPNALSGDLEPTVSALKQVLQEIAPVENVVVLQATNPLRPENLFLEAFETFHKGSYDSLFSVSRNQQKLGEIRDDKFIPYNYKIGQRSQDLNPLYFENGLLYISKSKLILEDTLISKDAYPFLTDSIYANIDIDTLEDFEYAEYLYQKHSTKNKKATPLNK
jgi:CMP-N-acetylneuraminic acid synthetase